LAASQKIYVCYFRGIASLSIYKIVPPLNT
jgi:hypothetical protein